MGTASEIWPTMSTSPYLPPLVRLITTGEPPNSKTAIGRLALLKSSVLSSLFLQQGKDDPTLLVNLNGAVLAFREGQEWGSDG